MIDLPGKILALTVPVLGPASKVFLERQTKMHLNGLALDKVTPQHLPELAKWVGISAALLVDPGKAKFLASKIAGLAN